MAEPATPDPLPEIGKITISELWISLKAGLSDFRAAPAYGLFFALFYVVVGMGLTIIGASMFVWTLALSLGFPLIAPFAAVGLYEVSRRLEAQEPLVWGQIMGLVWSERTRQMPWIGVILLMIFLFWSFFAHLLFALFFGPSALISSAATQDLLLTPEGIRMLAVQILVGAAVAYLTFNLTVVSLPLLMEREVDFVSAMLLSIRTVQRNRRVMLAWAAIIAAALFLAMVPLFLGLFFVLPVLGHATWHLYRRALYDPV